MNQDRKRIWVCIMGETCCKLTGPSPQDVLDALQKAVIDQKVEDRIEVAGTTCLGLCKDEAHRPQGPNARVKSGRSSSASYCHLEPADAPEIIAAHVDGDRPVERKLRKIPRVK